MMVEHRTVFPAPGMPYSYSDRPGNIQAESSWDEVN
jgi:hypothetical protein